MLFNDNESAAIRIRSRYRKDRDSLRFWCMWTRGVVRGGSRGYHVHVVVSVYWLVVGRLHKASNASGEVFAYVCAK